MKTRGWIGPGKNEGKEIRILGRKVEWCEGKIVYEADDRNIAAVVKLVGLENKSKGLDAPMLVEDAGEAKEDNKELEADEATRFRSIAALANYVALDRPDIQVAVSVLRRDMSKPRRKVGFS